MQTDHTADQPGFGRRTKSGFELLNHTADIAIRAVAPRLDELLHQCAVGLYAVIGELTTLASTTARRTFSFTGDEPAFLIRDYLAELLFLFEHERLVVVAQNAVRFEHQSLFVEALVEKIDNGASIMSHEVKAVTYHDLALIGSEGSYEFTFVADI